MITEIKLVNFKGFKSLVLHDLKRISLVSGKNNIGKSSLLDAFFLLLAHQSSEVFLKLASFRAVSYATPIELWESLFYNKDTKNPFQIEFKYDDGTQAKIEYVRAKNIAFMNEIKAPADVLSSLKDAIRNNYSLQFVFTHDKYREDGYSIVSSSTILNKIKTNNSNNTLEKMPFAIYINSLMMAIDGATVAWLGKIETNNLKKVLINALQLLDPSVIDIVTLSMGGPAQLYIKTKNTMLPFFLAGDGLKRLLYLVSVIIAHPNTLLLVDEVENGFHYSMYVQIWKLLSQLAIQYNCQLIVTTHSYENINSALKGIEMAGAENDFCYYRLGSNRNHSVEGFRSTPEVLRTALATNLEVR